MLAFTMPRRKTKGGKLTSNELEKFVDASYKPRRDALNIDGYTLDHALSSKKSKVYHNPKTGKVVVAHAGTSSAKDWMNNPSILIGRYDKTKRYKDIEDTQRRANEKYGQSNVETVSHSQSSEAARLMAQRGLTESSVALNPAIIRPHPGVDTVRSSGDVVSALTPMGERDVTIPTKKWYDVLGNHSAKILDGTRHIFGRGMLEEGPKRYL
jgi:hypothetical protein